MSLEENVRQNVVALGFAGEELEKISRRLIQHISFLHGQTPNLSQDFFDFKAKAAHLSTLLGVELEDIKKAALLHPSILVRDPETVYENATVTARTLGLDKNEFISTSLRFAPDVFFRTAGHIDGNVIACAGVLGISRSEYINLIDGHPGLFNIGRERLETHIETGSELLGLNRDAYIKALKTEPTLLSMKPETVLDYAQRTASYLGITTKKYIAAVCDQGQEQLFTRTPETVQRNVDGAINLLHVSRDDYIKAALKRITLLATSPERVHHNAVETPRLLGLASQAYIDKIMKSSPQLLTMTPNKINGNAEETARLLSIEKSIYVASVMKAPQIFYQSPATIADRMDLACDLLDIDRETYIGMALKQPALFYRDPETLLKNKKLIHLFHEKGILHDDPRDFYIGKPDILCLAQENFHLRYIFAKATGIKDVKGFGLLRRPKHEVEKELVRAFGHNPDEKVITRPIVRGQHVSADEKAHRAMVGLIRRKIITGYRYEPQHDNI
jgi:hypothetical protein